MQDQQKTDELEAFIASEAKKVAARMNRDDHPGLIHGTGVATVATTSAHHFRAGDRITVVGARTGSRWRRLRMLFTKPRKHVVADVTSHGFTIVERRMTWREWWRAVWRELRP